MDGMNCFSLGGRTGGGLAAVASALALGLLAGACANSERLGVANLGSRSLAPPAQAAPQPQFEPPPPSSPIQSAPLAPPPGAAQAPIEASPPVAGAPGPDPRFSTPPAPGTPPPAPRQIEQPPTLGGGGGQIATLGGEPTRSRGPVSSRDGLLGGWTARETNGATCRINLSSQPALDLQRASSSGCQNRDLQNVTAWDLRDGEVFIYKPGGAVTARLRVSDGSSMIGIISRSGATLNMSR